MTSGGHTLGITHSGTACLKLRTHINLIVGCLSAAFIALAVSVEVDSTRRAVGEEIYAVNVVASQILGQVVASQGQANQPSEPLVKFLESLGRVRANEITLADRDGIVLYRSPGSTYKAGRSAPKWFVRLLLPSEATQQFTTANGARLTVAANASRAILDGWDDIRRLILGGLLALGVLAVLVFWLVGRALAPLPVIAKGLARLQEGDLAFRLPPLHGYEAHIIGRAFNDMALAVQQKVDAQRQAREAEARLDDRRELALLIEQRIEEERRMIARELHDEFAQSVTAIRSLAVVIATQTRESGSSAHEAAQLISTEAARLYDAMHGLIPRLAPLTLDTVGLGDTLASFVTEWQSRNPDVQLSLKQSLEAELGPSVALAVYRIAQEGLINALRHGKPTAVSIEVDARAERVAVKVADDGVGLPVDWMRPGRFGLRGLMERVEKLRGSLQVGSAHDGRGVLLSAEIPLGAAMRAEPKLRVGVTP